jgi:VCBS repeat-containing protein
VLAYGATALGGDFARGHASGAVAVGGIYAFADVGMAGNTILDVQPAGGDFTPGFLELRLKNDSGAIVSTIDLSYAIWSYNDQARANSLSFSYSLDGIVFTPVAELDFVTAEAADAGPAWQQSLRSVTGLKVDLAPAEAVILRWTGDDATGTGERDQYGIDNVVAEFTAAETLAIASVTQGANGGVAVNPDGTISYTPNANFHGTDRFTYTLSDGAGGSDTATVTVTVTPVNDAPDAVNDSASTAEDTPVTIPVLANDSDIDPQAHTVFATGFDAFLGTGFAPEPAPGELDSHLWSAGGFSDPADLARGSSSLPVVPGGLYAFTDVGTTGNTILGVQPSGDDFTPGFIELRLVNDSGAGVAFVELSYEIWTYNDQERANSLDFSYSLDGVSFVSVAALDFVTAEARDAAPAWQRTLRSLAGLAVDLDPGEAIILRWSGDDVSGGGGRDEYGIDNVRVGFAAANEGLAVSAVTQGANGNVSANADGTVSYAPNANFHGTDSFTYTVSDGELTGTATVTVTVTPVNDAPVLAPIGSQAVQEDMALTFTATATDVDGDAFTFSLDAGAPAGAVIDAHSGVFTWTPSEAGAYSITVRVTDDHTPSLDDFETITITVQAGLADLTGTLVWEPGELLIPGDSESATLTVRNEGGVAVSGPVQVKLYASADGVLDAGDMLLVAGETLAGLAAGASSALELSFTFTSSLLPRGYVLLADIDPDGQVPESNEDNNVAVTEVFDFRWMFGDVPGHGRETLFVRDGDGTLVAFTLLGSGTGEITLDDEREWDMLVTGTNSLSVVAVLTLGGGDGRVALDDIHAAGALGALLAPTTDLTGTLAIGGPVTFGIVIGSATGALIAVASLPAIAVLGNVVDSRIVVGGDLGADGQPGGSGADADTLAADDLGSLVILGSMTSSLVVVGADIGSISIGGEMSSDSAFVAADLPRFAWIDGERITTALDPRFAEETGAAWLEEWLAYALPPEE